MRLLRSLLTCVVMLGLIVPFTASRAGAAVAPDSPVHITGLDLHDGMAAQFNGRYYLYGTRYGCGFHWLAAHTPFCGFGVSSSTDLRHWSRPRLLFQPTERDPVDSQSWTRVCGATGRGCFNPRMIRRTWGSGDGSFILWFNAPADSGGSGGNAYYAMGCAGPAGPCGSVSGGAHGFTRRPALHQCATYGDFGISPAADGPPYLVCTQGGSGLAVEQLDDSGANGTGIGATGIADLTDVEAPGLFQDAATGMWFLTYAQPNCGYCSGTGTSYAEAPSPTGPWTVPENSQISPQSCSGQPRTVSILGGRPYQGIDLWQRHRADWKNQTPADVELTPLHVGWDGIAPLTC